MQIWEIFKKKRRNMYNNITKMTSISKITRIYFSEDYFFNDEYF